MTLDDLKIKWPYHVYINRGGTAYTKDTDHIDRWQWWRLSDYRVTSVIAGTIWLRKLED